MLAKNSKFMCHSSLKHMFYILSWKKFDNKEFGEKVSKSEQVLFHNTYSNETRKTKGVYK
jgi:hypothetical protein